MNARFTELKNSDLTTPEGLIGKIVDLLVEDEHWMVRYLVVSIQGSFSAEPKRILISPAAVLTVNLKSGVVTTNLDLISIQNSPLLDDDQPVSRKHEQALVEHYGWPVYWLGSTVLPPQKLEALASDDDAFRVDENSLSNLRSADEICGYQIRSKNGKAGVMNDLVIRLDQWSVQYGVAESSTWLPSESSMFSINHIDSVNWSTREITVDLSREALIPDVATKWSFTPAYQTSQLFAPRRTGLE